MDLLQGFLSFFQENKLFTPEQKGLLAISGGIDSMVMLDLFGRTKLPFSVAHANFQLRAESDADEAFVKDVTNNWNAAFYVKRFATADEAAKQKLSIQMAARELRYQWFASLVQSEGFDYVAMAHHLNDSIETLLLNLTKGTGIAGLQGISMKRGNFVRPMLFTTRQQIETYAKAYNIRWVEDSSNSSDKYQRNWVRHKVVPMLKQINPSLEETYKTTQRRLEGTQRIFEASMEKTRQEVVSPLPRGISIHIETLLKQVDPLTQLFYLIEPYGFKFKQAGAIFSKLTGQAGAVFYSPTHQMLRERGVLVIESKKLSNTLNEYVVHEADFTRNESLNIGGQRFSLQIIKKGTLLAIPKEPNTAALDYDSLRFPLIFRRWKEGDRFQPFGMEQSKKLSDFFTDIKLNRFEKERVWLLVDKQGHIVWVAGHRIGNRYRIKTKTNNVAMIQLQA